MTDLAYVNLLEATLHDLYLISAECQATGVYTLEVGPITAAVTRTELDKISGNPCKLVDLIKKKIQG